MSRTLRYFGLLLTLPLLATDPTTRGADVAHFDDLVRLVRSDPEPTAVLEKCGDTVFTLNQVQRGRLRSAGASAALIDALQTRRMALDDVQNFALIVDCSGSMKEKLPDGRTKMDAARSVLTELVKTIPDGLNVSLTLYGQDVAAKCDSVQVKRPMGEIDAASREALIGIIKGLEPSGATPIAAALLAASRTLEGAKGLSQVVLVTDGMETCHADPSAVAESVTLKHHLRRVEVVGLGMKPGEKEAVIRIARRGRGKYYDAQTAQALAPALRKVVRVALEEPPRPRAEEPGEKAEELSPLVQLLVDGLKDKDGHVRKLSAQKLGELGDKARGAVPALMKRVADDEMTIVGEKDVALATLRKLAPDRVEKALTDAARSKASGVRQWAIEKLTELEKDPKGGDSARAESSKAGAGSDLPPLVQLLVNGLKDKNGHVRKQSAQKLGELGDKARGAVPALMQRVADDEMTIVGEKDVALATLKKLAPDRVEKALTDAARSKASGVKQWAIEKLTDLEKEKR